MGIRNKKSPRSWTFHSELLRLAKELYTVEAVVNPQAFAITLEELGEKLAPNFNQLYVIGNV